MPCRPTAATLDLAPDRAGPATPDEPAPPDPAGPPPPEPPAPTRATRAARPPPEPPEPPEQPDVVRDLVDDVTGLLPVTGPVGDAVLDLLGPRAS